MPLFTNPVQPWTVATDAASLAGAATTLLVANAVYLYAFEVAANITATGIKWRMGSTATGTTDVGIYDVNGNLLAHTSGVTNSASSTMTGTFSSSLTMSPGQYFLALVAVNATDTYLAITGATALTPTSRYRLATNSGSGTPVQLPATTGGYAATATRAPAMELVISGGLT